MIKKEDCMDLPPIVYEKRTIEMSSMQRAKYKEMQKELVLTIEKLGVVATGEIILKKIMKLTEITSGFVISENGEELELGFNPKMKELAELLEGELKGKKVVVWARFTRTIELLAKKFKHLNPAIVWGGDKNMVSRAEEIDRFQSNPDCLLFIGQISLAYGFNLFASDTAIYIEHDFSSEHRIQTIGRIHRSGQKGKKVTVIDIAMADSIDTHMIESYGSKRVIADFIYSILGIKGKEARFEK